jgi:large-conductance mechanosensitive channel
MPFLATPLITNNVRILFFCLSPLGPCQILRGLDPAGILFFGHLGVGTISYQVTTLLVLCFLRGFYLTLVAGYSVLQSRPPYGVHIFGTIGGITVVFMAEFCTIARAFTDDRFWTYGIFLWSLLVPEVLAMVMYIRGVRLLEQSYNEVRQRAVSRLSVSDSSVAVALRKMKRLLAAMIVVMLITAFFQVWLGAATIGEIEEPVKEDRFELGSVLFYVIHTVVVAVSIWFVIPNTRSKCRNTRSNPATVTAAPSVAATWSVTTTTTTSQKEKRTSAVNVYQTNTPSKGLGHRNSAQAGPGSGSTRTSVTFPSMSQCSDRLSVSTGFDHSRHASNVSDQWFESDSNAVAATASTADDGIRCSASSDSPTGPGIIQVIDSIAVAAADSESEAAAPALLQHGDDTGTSAALTVTITEPDTI